ncbi:MAG: hypothetical protein M3N28_09570 [Actinomycetota bacterium]|nr:hypothetical protein [Actinomycetota bacterium]
MSYPSGPEGPSGQPGGWQPGPPPPSPSQGYPPPPGGYGGYSQRPTPQTEGTAITVLVLAIASFVICPVIPAVVALFMCPGARRKIEGSGGALTGEGLVTAAKIISWVNLGLWGAGLLLVIVVGILGAVFSDSSDEFSMVLALLG